MGPGGLPQNGVPILYGKTFIASSLNVLKLFVLLLRHVTNELIIKDSL